MASSGEAPFTCPVCGEACRAVIELGPVLTGSALGGATEAIVQAKIQKLTGCVHAESFTSADH
jgi:hypothetical protein